MIDHTIGNVVVPIWTANISGRCRARAIHIPNRAPTNPRAIDTRQPPREYPLIACPSDPQMPAIKSSSSKSKSVMMLDRAKPGNCGVLVRLRAGCPRSQCSSLLLSQLVSINLAALHNELHSFQLGYVTERIPANGDDVGIPAWFHRTQVIRTFEQVRRCDRC